MDEHVFKLKEYLNSKEHMIHQIHTGQLPFTDDGGITLRFVKGQYLVWKPNIKLDHEILEGSLVHVGATKKSVSMWNKNDHEKDSTKYYIKVKLDRLVNIPGIETSKENELDILGSGIDRELDTVYFFEPSKDRTFIIEKIIYHYNEGDKIRIAFRGKKFFIDERNIEKEDTSPFWSIKGTEVHNGIRMIPWVEHHHPLTGRTFSAPLLRKSVKYVCQGCGRRAPNRIVTQMKLLK